jgi:hypothetical protein
MKSIWMVMLICMLYSCALPRKSTKPVLKGTVHFCASSRPDTLYVKLSSSSIAHPSFIKLEGPDSLLVLTDTIFTLSPKPGRYTLSVFAFGFEPLRAQLLIPDSAIVQKADVYLHPISIDTNKVRYIHVFGDFCDWNLFRGKPLVKSGRVWKIDANRFMKIGAQYKLDMDKNNSNFYDLNNPAYTVVPDWTSFNSVYKGGNIVFDPSLYAKSNEPHTTVHFDGWKPQLAYQKVTNFVSLDSHMNKIAAFADAVEGKMRDSVFVEWYNEFVFLQSADGKMFPDILVRAKWEMISGQHPVRRQYLKNILDSKKTNLNDYYRSKAYHSFFNLIRQTLGEVDSSFACTLDPSPLLDMDRAIQFDPRLIGGVTGVEEVHFQYQLGRFADIALEWEKTASDTMNAANLLWKMAAIYFDTGEYEKSKWVARRLVAKYPTSSQVKDGWIAKLGVTIKLDKGRPFPDFLFISTDGARFRFSDVKAPFIFINIWAPACLFSSDETKNVASLRDQLSKDKLMIIGLANADKIEDLKRLINLYDLNYPNMMMDEVLMDKIGVVAYPASYFIGPDRKIIARDLRGKDLTKLVQNLIK